MTHLTTTHPLAKGSIVSGPNRQIRDYLREHGPVSLDTLNKRFRNLAVSLGKGAPQFLSERLGRRREQGHVRRIFDDAGRALWDAVREEQENDAAPAHQPERMALPRRVDMFGPVYVPPKLVTRSGAMDYAAVPSLRMGRREPFRTKGDCE